MQITDEGATPAGECGHNNEELTDECLVRCLDCDTVFYSPEE